MIFNHIIELYLLAYISVLIHEFAHFIAGKAIGLHIESIHIGDKFFCVHIKRFYISFLIFGSSYVEFDSDELKNKSRRGICLFFLSGALANLLLAVIAAILLNVSRLYMSSLFWINIYLFIWNLFPLFLRKNDAGRLKYYLKTGKRQQKQHRNKGML